MKKKVVKRVLCLVIIALFLTCIFSLYNVIFSGKQKINVIVGKKYYAGEKIEAIADVTKAKNNDLLKSKLKVVLKDEDEKNVKKTKSSYKLEEGEKANISIPLPEDLETGRYTLQITSKSKLLKDTAKIPIIIENEKEANINVFLDKGIYKPGDEVNYRILTTSVANDKPIEEYVSIYIYDGNDNKVYSNEAELSEYGIASGNFTLASEVNSGEYKIVIERENSSVTKKFKVNPYITPKYETTITTSKDNFLVGENIEFTVNSKYFFGEPVKNATITGKVNDKEIKGISDENGNYTFNVEAKETGKLSANLEIIDSSNYSVEASKTVTVATNVFEIEVLPEFGEIVKGIDNDIFIITKKADGTPVKTYGNVEFNGILRQVITDDNGVGKISFSESDFDNINISDSYSSYYKENKNNFKTIKISAENMNGEKVDFSKEIEVKKLNGTMIKTDKLKYNIGEDININLKTNNDGNDKKIAIYKNNKLLKLVSTDSNEISVNLDDTYGIVDIYSCENRGYYSEELENKKTIYIIPDKKLEIGITKDAEEYKPGDKLKLNFETKNQDNELVDSALLVSILDEAILNVENNDLSIDNISLSLSNIELTNDINAADLYAAAIDEKSETLFMSILLRDTSSYNDITKTSYRLDYEEEERNVLIFVISLISLLVISFITLLIYNKNKEKIINITVKIINFVVIYFIVLLFIGNLLIDSFEFNMVLTFFTNLVVTVILYLLVLNKYDKLIFNMIIDILLLPIIAVSLAEFIEGYVVLVALVCPFVLSILNYLNRNRKNKIMPKVERILSRITKGEIISLGTIILGVIANEILIEILDLSYRLRFIEIIISILVFIFIYYLLYKSLYKKDSKKIENGKIVIDLSGMDLMGVIIAIVLILVVFCGIFQNSRSILSTPQINDAIMPEFSTSDSKGGVSFGDANSFTTQSDTVTESNDLTNFFDKITDSKNQTFQEDVDYEEDYEEEEKSEKVEENVRNVFLESLAFIPELITEDGKAEKEIKISDNITKWNIQVVGNTKNGEIGYNTSSFKVFKEFFVDFSLPTNSVVSDKTNIPATIYNYTENDLKVSLNVKENDWCRIGNYEKEIVVPAKNTKMVYIPLEIVRAGNNNLRVEAKSNNLTDIIERKIEVKPNGLEKSNIISSGRMEKKMEQDIIFNDKEMIAGTQNLKLKIYPSAISQSVEGMENILRMPTGCFEQTSSALYPNILVLEYLENNNLSNNEVKEKAMKYISSGYQRLLTFEVPSEKGGFSLYGDSPAETVLTAYGLMELNELSNVYEVDSKVLENMGEFLFEKQNVNGTFKYDSTYIGNPSSTDKLAMNAYIIWALSEVVPEDERLEKSIKYLEDNLEKVEDNYTLALITNALINTESKKKDIAIKKLNNKVNINGEYAYVSSSTRDYYGCYGRTQNIQTTALTSIAFTKSKTNNKTNNLLINYLISQKDNYGTWYSTQSTVLALRALVEYSDGSSITNQEIKVKLNGKEQIIKVDKDSLDFYEVEFDNVEKENKLSIEMKKGKVFYEIVKEYYADYSKIEEKNKKDFLVKSTLDTEGKVNGKITHKLWIVNLNKDVVSNGLIQIYIPQGTTVDEESLLKLKYDNIIEKYEYGYGKINLYIRNLSDKNALDFEINYKALYPEKITGGSVRVYDYYNPEIEEIVKPTEITITE